MTKVHLCSLVILPTVNIILRTSYFPLGIFLVLLFLEPFSDMEYVTSVKIMPFCHSYIGVFYVNVLYSFIQAWQDHYGKSHNACVMFHTWCAKGSGGTTGEQQWIEKFYSMKVEESFLFSPRLHQWWILKLILALKIELMTIVSMSDARPYFSLWIPLIKILINLIIY